MKLLQKVIYTIIFAFIYTSTFQCMAQKNGKFIPVFEDQLPFKVNSVSFQEWYAGIEVGGTGINIFVPITELDENVEITHIYFRNLTGELSINNDNYVAILKNNSRHYTFKKAEAPANYPFSLKDNECVVAYIEGGTTKYLKIDQVDEFAGIYYENGPPSIYDKKPSTVLASNDDEIDE